MVYNFQFKSPEGIIYTEVAHNETPKDGVQRRENNGPTDYAQVHTNMMNHKGVGYAR